MLLLIGVALCFGQAIVWAESAPELNRNDGALTTASLAEKTLEIMQNATENTLKYCLEIHAAPGLSAEEKMFRFEKLVENVTIIVGQEGMTLESLFQEDSALDSIQEEIASVLTKDFATVKSETLARGVAEENLLDNIEECEKSLQFIWGLVMQTTPRLSQMADPDLS